MERNDWVVRLEQEKKEQQEKEQQKKEKELGEVFAESPTAVLTDDFESRVMALKRHKNIAPQNSCLISC